MTIPEERRHVAALDRDHSKERAHLSLDSALAGMCLVAIPFGALTIKSGGRALLMPFSSGIYLLLLLNLAFGAPAWRAGRDVASLPAVALPAPNAATR